MQSILDAITEWIKEILIEAINGNLSTMFGGVNKKAGTIAVEVGQTPQRWNAEYTIFKETKLNSHYNSIAVLKTMTATIFLRSSFLVLI